MSDVDDQIERARAMMARVADGRDAPVRRRTRQAIGRRLTRIAIADAAILVAAIVIGWVIPLGIGGALLVLLLLLATTIGLAFWPAEAAPTAERLRQADLRTLPAQTERWLDGQRRNLPSAAQPVIDGIGTRLDTLSPQLGRVDQESETAQELRRLIGEQLPAFVGDYARVPASLRGAARNGRTPDAELVDGLKLIDQEIADMTARLAASDLDSLQTRGRYLELKYKGDPAT